MFNQSNVAPECSKTPNHINKYNGKLPSNDPNSPFFNSISSIFYALSYNKIKNSVGSIFYRLSYKIKLALDQFIADKTGISLKSYFRQDLHTLTLSKRIHVSLAILVFATVNKKKCLKLTLRNYYK
uniref:Uncharacterized protein n=1 Tax=Glossina brevipalpis TaxID=37001 RepID=A0A1A9WHU7_9MUSC